MGDSLEAWRDVLGPVLSLIHGLVAPGQLCAIGAAVEDRAVEDRSSGSGETVRQYRRVSLHRHADRVLVELPLDLPCHPCDCLPVDCYVCHICMAPLSEEQDHLRTTTM